MKKINILACFLLLSSCLEMHQPLIGGAKTKEGCLSSAGESWSELRKKCIRVFEDGVRLNPIEFEKGKAVISSFIVFNAERTKAELFLANSDKTIILNQVEDGKYANAGFFYETKTGLLSKNGKSLYKKEISR